MQNTLPLIQDLFEPVDRVHMFVSVWQLYFDHLLSQSSSAARVKRVQQPLQPSHRPLTPTPPEKQQAKEPVRKRKRDPKERSSGGDERAEISSK